MTEDPTTRLMLKLEQIIHRNGWDEPPRLYAIKRYNNKLALSVEMPVPWQGSPAVNLQNIAARMAEGDEWGDLLARSIAMIPGFDGLLFAFEAWSNWIAPSERDGRMLADIPGSKEMRGVFVVDVRGGMHLMRRIRGEKPTAEKYDEQSGRAVHALVTMVRAIATHLPDDAVDRKALDAIELLSDEEIEAKHAAKKAEGVLPEPYGGPHTDG